MNAFFSEFSILGINRLINLAVTLISLERRFCFLIFRTFLRDAVESKVLWSFWIIFWAWILLKYIQYEDNLKSFHFSNYDFLLISTPRHPHELKPQFSNRFLVLLSSSSPKVRLLSSFFAILTNFPLILIKNSFSITKKSFFKIPHS